MAAVQNCTAVATERVELGGSTSRAGAVTYRLRRNRHQTEFQPASYAVDCLRNIHHEALTASDSCDITPAIGTLSRGFTNETAASLTLVTPGYSHFTARMPSFAVLSQGGGTRRGIFRQQLAMNVRFRHWEVQHFSNQRDRSFCPMLPNCGRARLTGRALGRNQLPIGRPSSCCVTGLAQESMTRGLTAARCGSRLAIARLTAVILGGFCNIVQSH